MSASGQVEEIRRLVKRITNGQDVANNARRVLRALDDLAHAITQLEQDLARTKRAAREDS